MSLMSDLLALHQNVWFVLFVRFVPFLSWFVLVCGGLSPRPGQWSWESLAGWWADTSRTTGGRAPQPGDGGQQAGYREGGEAVMPQALCINRKFYVLIFVYSTF